RIGLHNPERIASSMARAMNFLVRVGAPAVRVLGASTNLMLKLIRFKPSEEPPVTQEEIKVMMEQGTEAGVFEEAEHDIVKSIFKLGDRGVGGFITDRTGV